MRAEDLPRSHTKPHLELAHFISEDMGLRVETEYPVGLYSLDILVPEAWCGVEYDGLGHSQPRQVERDKVRDEWILRMAAIPILRVSPLMLHERDDLRDVLEQFFEAWSQTCEKRTKFGQWTRR